MHLNQPLLDLARRLAHQADASLILFSSMLLALDLFFIAVFAVHRIETAFSDDVPPRLAGEWHIGRDWSYAEIFGYLKLGFIVVVLAAIRGGRERPIYPALAVLFAVALLDDALRLHERLGRLVVELLALPSAAVGELMIWTILSVFLLTGAYASFLRSPREDRPAGLLLLGAFAVLGLFAVVADLVHVALLREFRSSAVDGFLTVLEDGGEQITLTLSCTLALLVYRELRSRRGSGHR